MLAIENVGNLISPSSFDLGEAHKVVVLYVDLGVEQCIRYAKQAYYDIEIIQISATKGNNFMD